MEGLQLLSRQEPGEVTIDNFQELREALSGVLNRYEHLVYTDDMLADAKADKKELTRLRRELDDRRKEVKLAYLAPYNAFEGKVKELLAMIDAPLEEIKGFIVSMEEREKAVKQQELEAYFRRKSGPLGELAEQVLMDRPVGDEDIARAVRERRLYPCIFGSALKMQGIE